jgi:hypothetical protein
LQEVPKAYHTQIQEVLVTALALALRDWTGTGKLLVESLESRRSHLLAISGMVIDATEPTAVTKFNSSNYFNLKHLLIRPRSDLRYNPHDATLYRSSYLAATCGV